jgi:hypothetical protein
MYYYLASPYSKKNDKGEWDYETMDHRYWQVLHAAGWLLSREFHVFSPIVYTHEVAKRHKLPVTHEFWQTLNHAFISPAKGLIILALDGWRESRGITDEIEQAGRLSKPISMMYRNFDSYDIRPGVPSGP